MKKAPQRNVVDSRDSREALMLVRTDGKVKYATPLALRWLQEHFGVKHDRLRLSLPLRKWLADPNRKPGRCRPFTKETDHARLVISMLRDETDNSFALLLEQHRLDAPRTRLRHHGITDRENQVLALMAADKTGDDIANSLGVAGSTIKRHVEHIFEKYNVRTRAAAVAVWHQRRDNPPQVK